MLLPAIKPHYAILLIVTTCFAYGLSIGMDFVLLPLLFKNYGASKTVIGLLMGVEITAAFCMSPLLPGLIRKLGMGKVLLLAALVRNTVLLVLPFLPSPLFWFAAMFVGGTGGFSLYITIQMWVNSLATNKRRATALSALTAFMSLGIAVGPLVLTLTGRGGYLPFLVSSLLCSFILLPFFLIRANLPQYQVTEKAPLHVFAIIKKSPIPLLGGTMSDFIFFSMSSFLVLYGLQHGLSEANAALLITAMMTGGIIVEIPAGWISDHVNRLGMMVVCTVIVLLCSQLLSYAIKSTYGVWLFFTLCSGAMTSIYTSSLAILAETFKEQDLIAANSASAMMNSVGGISGVVVSGAAMDIFGAEGLTYSIAAACLFYLLLHYVNRRYKSFSQKE